MNHAYAQGYNLNDLGTNPRQLEINSHAVDVLPFNLQRIEKGPNHLVISGLSPYSDKIPSPNSRVARTSLCARYIGGRQPWIMYIFTYLKKTKNELSSVMSSWGCDTYNKAVVLDGGGFTGLIYRKGNGG